MNRRASLRLAVLSVVVAVGYIAGVGWTMYGMQADWPFLTWVLLGVGAVLLWLVMVGERTRPQWGAGLLVGLGLCLAILGWIGSGAGGAIPAYGGDDVYWAITYDWASNTLRFGETIPSARPPVRVHPNRALLLGGTLLTALGLSLGLTDRTMDAHPASPESAGTQ